MKRVSKRHVRRLIYKEREKNARRLMLCASDQEAVVSAAVPLARSEQVAEKASGDAPGCSSAVTFREKLKMWAIRSRITHKNLSELLKLLASENFNVPLCAESLLGKQSEILVKNISPGFYCNIGFKTQFSKLSDKLKDCDTVIVDVNIDGLPLYRSSGRNYGRF